MEAWCTTQEIDNLVAGSPDEALLQEHADHATSVLYALSGRRYRGEAIVQAQFQVDRRGYVKLTPWLPVRAVVTASIGDTEIPFALSPAGTYAAFAPAASGKIVTLTLDVGQNPPPMARAACAALAAEILRSDSRYALTQASDVRASSRLLSITRQGVTYTYADPTSLLENNMTGVFAVDLFLRAVNPSGARFQPRVVTA